MERQQVNGVDVPKLFETLARLEEDPSLARFEFRARNEWIGGTRCEAHVSAWYRAGAEAEGRPERTFEMDEPPVLLGRDAAANPVEYLLVALSGCLTTTLVVQAAIKEIELRRVSSSYEGDIDLRGFMNLDPDVPVGYREIRVLFDIDADVSEAQKRELVQLARQFSPVANTVAQRTPLAVELQAGQIPTGPRGEGRDAEAPR
jgi:uncharacterized OsmC-like protein